MFDDTLAGFQGCLLQLAGEQGSVEKVGKKKILCTGNFFRVVDSDNGDDEPT